VAVRNRRLAELGLFTTLAVLHTWPLITDPAHLTRLDNDDTAFNTWVVAWVAHQIANDPLNLFNAPIFYPARDALAFSEHMTVPSLMGAPMLWLGVSPVLVYNVLVIAGYALSGLAMAIVIRRWTGSFTAGVISGALFGFNAHVLTRFAHLQALHVEFLPFVLYAFDGLLRRPTLGAAMFLAAMFVLQALCSNYMMIMLSAALSIGLMVRRELWSSGAPRVWISLGIAGVLAAIALVPFLLPYARVRADQGLVRTLDEVRFYSATWEDYFATVGRLHYQTWANTLVDGRTALFPGLTGFGLALGATLGGAAWRDSRARMALALGVMGLTLSFGASLPGYSWLHEHVVPLQGIRAAARWGFLFLVSVAILAGFGVAQLEARWKVRQWWPALAVALLGLVTIEALRAPLALQRFAGIAPVHGRLKYEPVTGLVVFPLYGGAHFNHNARYLLDQTRHWHPMVNGYSSFAPASFFERAARLQSFPDANAIQELRSIRVSHIVLHRAPFEGAFGKDTLAALRSHPELQFVWEQDGVIIYRLTYPGTDFVGGTASR